MKRHFLVVCLVVFTLVIPSKTFCYNTNSFFLIIIDGLRNQEAFEDSTHQYIPRIWNDLRPLGTIYTNFYTMIRTATTPGHQVLLSGARTNMINNHRKDLTQFRSRYPTIFEYFRESTAIPADSVRIVTGKRNLNVCDYSIHPAFGEEFGAIHLGDVGKDTTAYQVAVDVIDTYHPRLMLINFKDVDALAHIGTFEDYTTAIQIADSLVYALYNHIQSDDFYEGNTTFFITTDHGRIDDLHGGFNHHGIGTHGDRSCFFLAIGPDINVDNVVEEKRTFIDIAPTVGELMGFNTPFAEGRVMSGMIAQPGPVTYTAGDHFSPPDKVSHNNVSDSEAASIYPSIAVTEDFIHVTWSEMDLSSQNENWHILYSRSSNGGANWSNPEVIFEINQIDGTVYRGNLEKGDGTGLVATVNGYYGYNDALDKRTYKWFGGFSRSDDGSIWTDPVDFENYSSIWKTILLQPPRVALDNQEMHVGWVTDSWFTVKESVNGGNDLITVFDYNQHQTISNEYLSSHDLAMDVNRFYYVVERNTTRKGQIWCLPYDRITHELKHLVRIDPDSTGSFSPSIGVGNGALHVVWTDLTAGFKGIYYSVSLDQGETFTSAALISEGNIDSWNPDISVVGDVIVVVWEDYRDGVSEIYSRASMDGGSSWGAFTRQTENTEFSIHPRIDSQGIDFYLSWQDMSEGNWDVFVKPLQFE
jgi:hypothetical protein